MKLHERAFEDAVTASLTEIGGYAPASEGRTPLDLGTADQLFFDQMEATWLGDEHLVEQALANPIDNFRLVFADRFLTSVVERMDDNGDIFKRILDDPAFQTVVMEHYLARVFASARTNEGSA